MEVVVGALDDDGPLRRHDFDVSVESSGPSHTVALEWVADRFR